MSSTSINERRDALMMVLSTILCFLLVFIATPALILIIAHSLF